MMGVRRRMCVYINIEQKQVIYLFDAFSWCALLFQ